MWTPAQVQNQNKKSGPSSNQNSDTMQEIEMGRKLGNGMELLFFIAHSSSYVR